MDNKASAGTKILDWGIIVVSLVVNALLWLRWGVEQNQLLNRLLFCIMLTIFGLGVRAAFYKKLFNPEEKEDLKSYIYYGLMLIMIAGFVYLGFHNILKDMTTKLFVILSFLIFPIMGLTVKTVLAKFDL